MSTETTTIAQPRCPECGGQMVKAGFKQTNRKGDRKQLYQCKDPKCWKRTVNPVMGA